MVPRRSPLSKGLARAQAEGQMSGNTSKRTRAEVLNPRPTKKRRSGVGDERDTEPIPEQVPRPSEGRIEDLGTPVRSRWHRLQATPSPNSESPLTQNIHRPTASGPLGSLAQAQRQEIASESPNQGREGPGMEGPIRRRTLKTREKPPDNVDQLKEPPPRDIIRPVRAEDPGKRGNQQ